MRQTVFRQTPPKELLERICADLHRPLSSFPCSISKDELEAYQWGDELFELLPYYVPSLLSRFVDSTTGYPTHTSTVLRHLLRAHGYDLVGKEEMTNYVKTLVYQLVPTKHDQPLDSEVVVSFS